MPIDARSERLFRVVEMERTDVLDADVFLEIVDRPFVLTRGTDVVTGGEDVAGIDADADAVSFVDEPEHLSELCEGTAETRSLSSGCLQERHHLVIGDGLVNGVERPGDLIDSLFDSGSHMCAWM